MPAYFSRGRPRQWIEDVEALNRVTVATLWLGWWLWLWIYSGTLVHEELLMDEADKDIYGKLYLWRKSGWAKFSGPWGCFPQTFVVWTLSVTEGMCLCLDLREIKRSQWSSLASRKVNYAQRQNLNSSRFENPMTREYTKSFLLLNAKAISPFRAGTKLLSVIF